VLEKIEQTKLNTTRFPFESKNITAAEGSAHQLSTDKSLYKLKNENKKTNKQEKKNHLKLLFE
jgi:hypothetical protein